MQYCDIHHVRYDDYCKCPACEDETAALDARLEAVKEARKQTRILEDISSKVSSKTSRETQLEAEVLRLKREMEELKRRR